jgi:hypothetical protein
MDFYSPASQKSIWYRHYTLKRVWDTFSYYYYSRFSKFNLENNFIVGDTTPVIINNFNRLKSLDILIKWLLSLNDRVSIIIVDNHSSFPPLLEYYATLNTRGITVIKLGRNYGTEALLPITLSLKNANTFVVTDADLVPYSTTPKNILTKMKEVLREYQTANHVGASLEINDLPDHYPLKPSVIEWESQFWKNKRRDGLYIANIDTTFAMYRAGSNVRKVSPALRLDRPYTLMHVDWYINPESIDEEYRYYMSSCNDAATWCTRFKEVI